MISRMTYSFLSLLLAATLSLSMTACDSTASDDDDDDDDDPQITLHTALAEFDTDNTTVMISGSNFVIETNGLTNHTSPYWSDTHPLNIDPIVTTLDQMAPGDIDDFNGMYTLTVPGNPVVASSPTATTLGPIGIAITGGMLYNDREAGNVPINGGPLLSLDYTSAHTGPQSYHYHLETKAWSDDDEKLIGIISDGFFIYGRKCDSSGDYPTDLDASGGHTSTTQHASEAEYHYHVINELYMDEYYILFAGNYQGTPNAIQ